MACDIFTIIETMHCIAMLKSSLYYPAHALIVLGLLLLYIFVEFFYN